MATSGSSNDTRNFQCVTVASVDVIKLPLRDILASHIQPKDLLQKIQSCSTLKLRQVQLKLCFVPPPDVPDYNKFDVTLLYTLIRNLCSLPCPAQGWGNEPKATDTQISDDIERLRLFRNNYYAHAESAVISDAVFEDVWKNLKLVFRRIQPKTGCSVDYEEELISIERSKFTDYQLDTCRILLDAFANMQKQTDGREEPTICIRGENEIIWGDTAHFEADVKKADSSCWSITWHRRRGDVIKCIDTSMENYSGSTKRKLVINSVCKEDEGEYQALLSFESKGPDYKSRNTIRLHVIGDVPSVSILVDSPVCFGSETIIKSEVSSTPTPERTEWQKSKDGTDFHLIGKPKIYFGSTEDFKSPFLVIPKTTFADKLFYRLLVWNRVGKSASNTIYLNVTGSPPNITTSFVTNIKNRSVKLMGEVYFFDNSPGILKTFWTKNGEKINIEESGGKLSEMITHNPSLTITNVGPDDAGEYKVTATNAVGSTTSEVIVLGIPSVFSERVEDEKNGGRRIIVTITSFPAPCQIQWNAKSKDDDTFTPIDINADEYDGTTVTFPNPVLVVRQRDQLEKKCYQIEVTNFIGKTVQTISGNNKPTVRKKDIVQNTFYKDRGARVRFTKLNNILAKEFPPQKLENLKFTLTNSNIVQNRTSVMEATSALECIRILQDEELFTQTDVIVMQFLCTQTECLDLHAKCVEYAEQQKALCYFEKPPVNGYKNAQFHVKGELSSYTKDYIQDVLETVAAILDCKVEDILLNGVRHSKSFLLFLSVKEVYMKKLLALNEQGRLRLIRLNIDYLIIDKETINLERPKGETCDNNPVVLKNTAAYLGLRTTQSFKERSPSTGVPLRNRVTGVSAPLSDIPDSSEPDDNQVDRHHAVLHRRSSPHARKGIQEETEQERLPSGQDHDPLTRFQGFLTTVEQNGEIKYVDSERLCSRKRRGSNDEVDESNRTQKKLRPSSPDVDDSRKENKTVTNGTESSSEIRKEEYLGEFTSLKEEGNEVENYIRHSTGSYDEPEGKRKKTVSSSPDVDNSKNENKKDTNEIEAVSQNTKEESTFDLTSVTEESNDAEVSNQISTFAKKIGVSANFKSPSLRYDNEDEYVSNNQEEDGIVLYEKSTEYNLERTESESGASTSSENDKMMKNEYVYRLLRFNEPYSQGLYPKDISSRITLEKHIENGSKGTFSRFISCCETMSGLNRLIGVTSQSSRVREVVRINITKLKDSKDVTIIKLTDENVRKEHIERYTKTWEYAEKFEEVVLSPRSHVPADCVEKIGFVQYRTFTKDEHITL